VSSEIENNEDMLIALLRVKKNQLDAQLILSIFRQLIHVSDVSRPIIRRYNRMYTTIGTYYYFRWLSVILVVVYIRLYLLMMGLDTSEICIR
jgi:hypothetical protein